MVKNELRISTGHLKHLKFMDGGILVNGDHATVRRVLKRGDVLYLATEDRPDDGNVEPCYNPLDVAYEDGDCVVPSKSADMPTHPSHGHYLDTVANALAFRAGERGEPFVFRPVNRLDRNTSGLLLVAKNRIAAGILSAQMSRGEIKKTYIALLCGELPRAEGFVESYMRRTAESIIVRENCSAEGGGDYALTRYKVLLTANGYTLAAASPITGRTHQLRVHFSGLGAPLLGDEMYGEPSELMGRHALHSTLLSFLRVSDGERITVTSPLPEDMRLATERIFGADALSEALYGECGDFLLDEREPEDGDVTVIEA